MARQAECNPCEKHRLREQISAQVDEYLQRRGTIEVLSPGASSRPPPAGRAWHDDYTADLPESWGE